MRSGGFIVALALVVSNARPGSARAEPRCEATTITVGTGALGYRATGEVCDGKRHGPWTFTFLGGERMREGAYERGLEQGVWKTFHPGGATQDEGAYVAGKPDGRWVRYAPNGTKIEERNFVLGKRDGQLTRWTADGKLYQIRSCTPGGCVTVCKAGTKRPCPPPPPATTKPAAKAPRARP